MVALEALPMHVNIFPELWLEFIKSADEGGQEFCNLSCTSCNYFREYIFIIMTQDRNFLNDDVVYEFIKECFPKVN
jgi:ubiquitinyl hydrolase 1